MLKIVCAIIIGDDKILTAQLAPGSGRAFEWEFPGGKINLGESAEEAVIREIGEELSIEITICNPLKTIIHNDGEKDFELIPFICTKVSGEINLAEHNQILWVSFAELEKLNLSAADRQLILASENRLILEKYAGKNMYNSC
jgi:8-oxo-dGTP diphosphatase